jgi:hypothetical protein
MKTTTDGTVPQQESPVGREYTEFELAVLSALPSDISPDIADGWCKNSDALAKALREALFPPDKPATASAAKPNPQVLRFIDEITLPARTEQFVPRANYVVNTKRDSHVKICYIDPDFTAWFGDKIEEPTAGTTLRCHAFNRPSMFVPAMKEVEGAGFVTETMPSQLFSMLEQQPDGPKSKLGLLRTNGYANLFKMIDVNGNARLVLVFWHDECVGWSVRARGALDSDRWSGEHRFFSSSSRSNPVA